MLKTKSSAIASLLLVFASGALVGVLGHRAYIINAAATAKEAPRRHDPRDWRKQFRAQLREKVQLDDKQATQVDQILNDVDTEYRGMFEQWNQAMAKIQDGLVAKINAVLLPAQQELYRQFREERERQRQQRRSGPPPPRPR